MQTVIYKYFLILHIYVEKELNHFGTFYIPFYCWIFLSFGIHVLCSMPLIYIF